MVDRLIDAGADVNARGVGRQTALMRAAKRGHSEIARKLLSSGARPDLRDRTGKTAESFARNEDLRALIQTAISELAGPDADSWRGLPKRIRLWFTSWF